MILQWYHSMAIPSPVYLRDSGITCYQIVLQLSITVLSKAESKDLEIGVKCTSLIWQRWNDLLYHNHNLALIRQNVLVLTVVIEWVHKHSLLAPDHTLWHKLCSAVFWKKQIAYWNSTLNLQRTLWTLSGEMEQSDKSSQCLMNSLTGHKSKRWFCFHDLSLEVSVVVDVVC